MDMSDDEMEFLVEFGDPEMRSWHDKIAKLKEEKEGIIAECESDKSKHERLYYVVQALHIAEGKLDACRMADKEKWAQKYAERKSKAQNAKAPKHMPAETQPRTPREIWLEASLRELETEKDAALLERDLALRKANLAILKLTYIEWERDKAKVAQSDVPEAGATIEDTLRILADTIAVEWEFYPSTMGRRARPLPELLVDIHTLLPEATGWDVASSSSPAPLDNKGVYSRVYDSIVLHIRPDRIPVSDELWLRVLKTSIFDVLRRSYQAYIQ